jgi:hypothetical protein
MVFKRPSVSLVKVLLEINLSEHIQSIINAVNTSGQKQNNGSKAKF